MAEPALHPRLAAELPDAPRWLETRGMLLSGRGRLVAGGAEGPGYGVFDDSVVSLLALVGRPVTRSLAVELERLRPRAVLVQEEDDAALRPLLERRGKRSVGRRPAFRRQVAILHRLSPDVALWPLGEDAPCRLLTSELSPAWLDSWPAARRRELAAACSRGLPMAGAVVGDEVAAVCYSCYETETLWDISIDTHPDYRRRGLASSAVRFLAARQSSRGLSPVWGAVESNRASLALAARLGFEPVERFVVYEAD